MDVLLGHYLLFAKLWYHICSQVVRTILPLSCYFKQTQVSIAQGHRRQSVCCFSFLAALFVKFFIRKIKDKRLKSKGVFADFQTKIKKIQGGVRIFLCSFELQNRIKSSLCFFKRLFQLFVLEILVTPPEFPILSVAKKLLCVHKFALRTILALKFCQIRKQSSS